MNEEYFPRAGLVMEGMDSITATAPPDPADSGRAAICATGLAFRSAGAMLPAR